MGSPVSGLGSDWGGTVFLGTDRMSDDTISNGENGRDANGRFAKGYAGGPGNPNLRRLGELQEALRRAVSPQDLTAVCKKLVELALDGDVQAMKLLFERTMGKVAVADDATRETLQLPPLVDAVSCRDAMSAVLSAMGEGFLSVDAAAKMASIVELGRRAIETVDLDRRLAALEEERRVYHR